jgi:SNF2 family DNA or RNA helicase
MKLKKLQLENPVVIHHLIAKNTIDKRVMQALKNKDTTQTALIDAVKADLGKGGNF